MINNKKAGNFIDLVRRKFGNQSNDAIKIFIAPALTILLLVLGPLKPFGYHILRFSTASTQRPIQTKTYENKRFGTLFKLSVYSLFTTFYVR